MAYNQDITHEELLAILSYNPETGVFTWKVKPSIGHEINRVVGTIRPKGYRIISIKGVRYSAHRLAWFYVNGAWPEDQLDHINGNKDDNRIINLREARNSENNQNKKVRSDSQSGLKGVGFDRRGNKWKSQIKVNGKYIHLGRFNTPEEAYAAYCRAAKEHFGEFANFG